MTWVRRILSIPLGVVFFVLLLVTLVVLQINSTFLDPGYYPKELRKANIYEFVLGDLLTSALDEARELDPPEGLDENPLVSSGLSTADIVTSINRAVPPEYVQGIIEDSFDQGGRYLTGERDEFAVTIKAGAQVKTIVDEFQSLLRKADSVNLLYEQEVIPRVEDAVDLELPFGVQVPTTRLVEAARRVATSEWVQEQVDSAIDEVTPYFVGERDTFKINVQLADRVEIALEEVKDILREADAYELLYSEVVEPELTKALGGTVDLPFGVSITSEEVLSSLRRVAPPDWVQEQVEALIDEASPYLTGKEDTFAIEISLADNKREARQVIVELVDKKTSEILGSLRQCASLAESAAALGGGSGGLPSCIPPQVSVTEILDRLSIDIAGGVSRLVLAPIPDDISFTDTDLRQALTLAGAGDNLDLLDEVREVLRDGYSYTQDDLRQELAKQGDDHVETLDDIRGFLSDGWTYTHNDFREDISDEAGGGAIEDFDRGRDKFKQARSFRWVVYVPIVLLLVAIGFLGGRGWSGRVVYASGFLLVYAGLIFLIFGPGYSTFAKSGPIYDAAGIEDLDELREDALVDIAEAGGDFPNTSRLVANKAFDIAESLADDFASGMAQRSLGLAIVGIVAMGAAIFWTQLVQVARRLRRRVGT